MKRLLFFFLLILLIPKTVVLTSGCAQIVAPTGGPRDSLPPKLISANPKNGSINFKGKIITLNFDEYIHTEDVVQNLLVSPTPIKNPYINYKLRTVTIKLLDTLEPNTTYTINLGNSIRDLNENNAIKDFSYVFSTGPTLDSATFSGNVVEAQTGKTDSTLIVLLYKNLADSAAIKLKPKYLARVNASGNFQFHNLAPGMYKVYALKDGDGSKNYDSKSEMFAFADAPVRVSDSTKPVNLFAYVEEVESPKSRVVADKKLRYTTKIFSEKQDILTDLLIEFNKPLKNYDLQKILLTDTLNRNIKTATASIDSAKKITIKNKWIEDADYKLIIPKDFATDSAGVAIAKSDTIRFKTKKEIDYGIIKLKFKNFDKTKNPVLQFIINDEVVKSYPLTINAWNADLFIPGDYELRILYDENKNGKWDAGNFVKKIQPEKVYSILTKLSVKGNFENDIDNIELPKSPL